MANCANMNLSINPGYDNIGFSWSGFDDTIQEYITQSILKMTSMDPTQLEKTFNQIKEKYLLDLSNFYLE
jgi:secreted Zn-dependent insulinase-like peptidase